jgi:hypothetical protein
MINDNDNKLIENKNISNPYDIVNEYYMNQNLNIKSNEKFIDNLFPPNEQSLFSKNSKGIYTDNENGPKFASIINKDEIEWKRISDLYPNNILYDDNMDIEDIRQGKLGICYFLSTLAQLTKYQKLLLQIFKTKKSNNQCYYEIIFFINGEYKIVLIDDFIPVIKNSNEPYFSKPNNNEIWVILLEKAWAKVNGGYTNIINGWPSELLTCLTGFPSNFIIIDEYENCNIDDIYFNISNYCNNSDCLIYITSRNDSKKNNEIDIEKKGLIKGHVYFIISCFMITNNNGDKIKLFEIENPWGNNDWKGLYSKKDSSWDNIIEEDKKKYLNNSNSFYITLDDMIKYFIRIDFLHMIFNSNIISLSYDFDKDENIKNKPNIFNIEIPNDDSYLSVMLSKEHWRFNKLLPSNLSIPSSIIIMKYNEDKKNFSDFNANYSDCDNCSINLIKLTKGKYMFLSFISYEHSNPVKPKKYFISIISNQEILVNELNELNIDDSFNLLNHMFIDAIKEKNFSEISLKDIYYDINNNFCNSGIGYRIVINPLENNYQKWINNTKEIINMFMLYPYENDIEFCFTVYPKSENICLGMKSGTYGSYWFNLKSSIKNYKTSNQEELKKRENFKPFNISKYIIYDNNKKFNYNYFSISKEKAMERKTYTQQEINELMIEELKKKDETLMNQILELDDINDNNLNLIWVYIQKENGFYMGQAKKNENETEIEKKIIREGKGAFKYSSPENLTYIGYWKNDMKNGKGKLIDNKNKIIFEGNFDNNKKNGIGKLIFINGDKYEGNFKEDIREGKGTYLWKDGSKWEGIFLNNQMNGNGFYYGNDGDNYEAIYKDGKFIE